MDTTDPGLMRTDPVAFEVLRGGMAQICEEMKSVVMRAAFSPLLSLSADLSCAVFDACGNVVAQGDDIPVHLGAMPFTARAMLDAFPADTWSDGDAVLSNDPYRGGTHLPDMTLMSPLVLDGAVAGFVASRVHWPDVGGPVPGSSSVSDHILHEGIRVPPVRILGQGNWNEAAVAILMANMRLPESRYGDMQAQAAGNRRGVARLEDLARRYGAARLRDAMAAVQDHSAAALRDGLAAFPPGRFTHEEELDGDGYGDGPFRIRATVWREGETMVVDFAGTSGPARGPVNAPAAVTASAAYYTILAALGGGATPNSGAWRHIEVRAPRGCLVAAEPPLPVVAANTETANRIVDVILGALAQAGPFGVAGSYGSAAVYTLGNAEFVHYETIGGGLGAGPGWPGVDGMRVHMGNTMNLPVEAMEAAMPVRFERYALAEASGGAGLHGGGRGVVKRLRALVDGLDASVLLERCRSEAPGRAGGGPGATASVTLHRVGQPQETLASKSRTRLASGDVLEIRTAGGGGWGETGGKRA